MASEDDADPIISSYDVFINPTLPNGRKLYVLQQANRIEASVNVYVPPTEMRLKARSGMVEVDIPVDTTVAYDKEKGLEWGRALSSSMAAKSGGSHGLAGGFGFGAPAPRPKKRGEGDVDEDAYMDWGEAVRQDKVLRTQTLGGHSTPLSHAQYMVGVFQGGE
jgi:DNA-directed RNA polymerase III subunit RPC5